MRISVPFEKLHFHYGNVGEGPIHGYGQDGFGLLQAIGEPSLKGKTFAQVAEKLKARMGDPEIQGKAIIRQVRDLMAKGPSQIYLEGRQEPIAILVDGGKHYVHAGNKRALALCLLGEKKLTGIRLEP